MKRINVIVRLDNDDEVLHKGALSIESGSEFLTIKEVPDRAFDPPDASYKYTNYVMSRVVSWKTTHRVDTQIDTLKWLPCLEDAMKEIAHLKRLAGVS